MQKLEKILRFIKDKNPFRHRYRILAIEHNAGWNFKVQIRYWNGDYWALVAYADTLEEAKQTIEKHKYPAKPEGEKLNIVHEE